MNILILDDHSLFSQGLRSIIKGNYSNLTCNFYKSIASLKDNFYEIEKLDLIISDIELPGEDIFEFLEEVKKDYPNIPILIVSMHNKLSVIKKCKELKIQGYILKDDHDLVITAIDEVIEGKEYFSEKVLKTLSILDEKDELLTPKEVEIIHLLVRGDDNNQIAQKLFISYNTVKTHRKNINKKLGISRTCELVEYYKKNYI
jgi:DNA-binding NarL/FixJ family response regulator